MSGIKNISNRVAARVGRPIKGNGGKSKPTGAQRSVTTHFEARAKQLAKFAEKLVENISRKGNDKPAKPTGVNRPTPHSGETSFEPCTPVHTRPAIFDPSNTPATIEIKGNSGAGRGTITRAGNFCGTGDQSPDVVKV